MSLAADPEPTPLRLKIAGYGPERLGAVEQARPLESSIPVPTLKIPRSDTGGATPNPRPLPPCDGGRGDLMVVVTAGDEKVRGGGPLVKSRVASRKSRVASRESLVSPRGPAVGARAAHRIRVRGRYAV